MPAENHVREGRGRRGGRARAASLNPAERQAIAEKAAQARWDPTIPEVEYGSDDRPLMLGGHQLGCYVLTGGTRVFSQIEALGLVVRGGQLRKLIEAVEPFLEPDVVKATENPIRFHRHGGGPLVDGYPVELLIDLCNAVIDASDKSVLSKHFSLTEVRAKVLVRAVAKVGIIALVDEATGYDEHRKDKLELLLDKYLREELAAWSKRFPDEFYFHIFRLRGWQWRGRGVNPPSAVAHYTKDLVYARMAPGLLKEIEARNPMVVNEQTGKRRRLAKNHQFLTADIGEPHLNQHLLMVIGIQRASVSWEGMMESLDRALPRVTETMQLPLLEWREPAA